MFKTSLKLRPMQPQQPRFFNSELGATFTLRTLDAFAHSPGSPPYLELALPRYCTLLLRC